MTDRHDENSIYLKPTKYIDSGDPLVISFAESAAGGARDKKQAAVWLFQSVRDSIRYNPYLFSPDPSIFTASGILKRGEGYCVQKAIVLAAVCRAAEIPCRLGFAIVRNHLTSDRLRALMRSDLFVFHGYNELLIEGRWVKATPTFDMALCEKFGVKPLEFDGENNAVFHQFDKSGRRHMEYVHDYGSFDDLPYDYMMQELLRYYPHLMEMYAESGNPGGDFASEASPTAGSAE